MDSKEWKGESQRVRTTSSWAHEDGMEWIVRCTPNLSQCRCDIKNVCKQVRENVTREVCCSHSVGCSILLSAVNDLTTTNLKNLVEVSLWAAQWESRFNRSPCSVMPLISRAQRYLTLMNLWAPPVVIPLPPWCAGWRRRRMPFLILVERNRCKSLFSRLTVKTVHLC